MRTLALVCRRQHAAFYKFWYCFTAEECAQQWSHDRALQHLLKGQVQQDISDLYLHSAAAVLQPLSTQRNEPNARCKCRRISFRQLCVFLTLLYCRANMECSCSCTAGWLDVLDSSTSQGNREDRNGGRRAQGVGE